jgi:hypothetical protein
MAGVTDGVPTKVLYEERWMLLLYHDVKDAGTEGGVLKRGLHGATRGAAIEAAATAGDEEFVNVLARDLHIWHLRALINLTLC